MKRLLLLTMLMACGPAITKTGDPLDSHPYYRIVDKERWADVNDAPHKFHNRASDPQDGAWYIVIAEGNKFCPVSEPEFFTATTGQLYQCDWRWAL